MATMPTFEQGKLIGPLEWNDHANQINTNTTDISAVTTDHNNLEAVVGTGVFTSTDTISAWATNAQGQIDTLETRTTDASTGNTALGNRVTTLEGLPRSAAFYGTWADAGGAVGGQTIDGDTGGGDKGVKVTDIDTVVETPNGCSFSTGTFTATQAGKWLFTVTTQYVGGNTAQRAVYLAKGNAADSPTGTKYGLNGGPSLDSQATTCRITLAANEQVSVYVACWTSTGSVQIWKAGGCTFTATWLGP